MMRKETKTEVKTQTPAGNGGVPAMRELVETGERISALLQRMCEREKKETEELTAMFARYKAAYKAARASPPPSGGDGGLSRGAGTGPREVLSEAKTSRGKGAPCENAISAPAKAGAW